MIQIEDLSICLTGSEILKKISLTVGKEEYVSIIGPNGAGKTTLIKCMAGLYQNWTGHINLCGNPFNDYSARERARLQSYVPQAGGRMHPLRVEEFVAMGRYPYLSAFTSLKRDDYRAIHSAIEQAGLEHLRHRVMNTLSGGERQMVYIAAALAQGAQILLLDEPSAFLDYRHQAEVASILRSACRDNGISIVAVHHDINAAAASSDRIYALREGRIVFEGRPDEALHRDTLKDIYETAFTSAIIADHPLPFVLPGGPE